MTDQNGQVVATCEYDAWDNVVKSDKKDIAADNLFGYAGYMYNKGIGMYDLIARYYNPDKLRETKSAYRNFRIFFYLGFSSCININCYVARYIFCIRMLFGTWVIFVTKTTIIAISKVIVIQLIILLLIWSFSKYVQKTRENWLITIVVVVIYGVGTYMYIQFAFRGY